MSDIEFNSLSDAVIMPATPRLVVGQGAGDPLAVPPEIFMREGRRGYGMLGDFSHWKAAKARAVTNPPRLVFLGDSNVLGHGANSGTDLFTHGVARYFATAMGYLTGSIIGSQRITTKAAYHAYNPLLTFSANIDVDGGSSGVLGGCMFKSAGSGTLTWTPAESFDHLKFVGPSLSGLDTGITVTIDGTLVDTFSESVGSGGVLIKDYNISGGPTTHTIVIGLGATATGYVSALILEDHTNGTPVYCQAGWDAATSGSLCSTGNLWHAAYEIDALDFDYGVIYCTINDANGANNLSTYYDNIEFLTKRLRTNGGDVCICYCFPINSGNNTGPYTNDQADVLKRIANDYDASYFDFRSVWGYSYNRCSDLGYNYDNLHPSESGHAAGGTALADFLGPSLNA